MRRRSEIPRSRHEWRVHSYKSNEASSRCHTLEAHRGLSFQQFHMICSNGCGVQEAFGLGLSIL